MALSPNANNVYLPIYPEIKENDYTDYQEIDCDLNQVVAANGGEIPKPLKHAMKIIVEYFYNNRGSDDVAQIPEAFFHMCKLYRRYKY